MQQLVPSLASESRPALGLNPDEWRTNSAARRSCDHGARSWCTPVMLHKVLAAQQAAGSSIDSCVIGLIQDGPIGEQIRSLGIPVVSLGMRPGVPDPRALWAAGR